MLMSRAEVVEVGGIGKDEAKFKATIREDDIDRCKLAIED